MAAISYEDMLTRARRSVLAAMIRNKIVRERRGALVILAPLRIKIRSTSATRRERHAEQEGRGLGASEADS
jgi:hypothetical protein